MNIPTIKGFIIGMIVKENPNITDKELEIKYNEILVELQKEDTMLKLSTIKELVLSIQYNEDEIMSDAKNMTEKIIQSTTYKDFSTSI